MAETDDWTLFVSYLQRQLVDPGTEQLLDSQLAQFEASKSALLQQIQELQSSADTAGTHLFSNLRQALIDFESATPYDSFFAHQIFEPLLADITRYAEASGLGLRSPVTFANSPSLQPSATAWPSKSGHVLLAGHGTFGFCNYWAKVFTHFLMAIPDAHRLEDREFSLEELRDVLSRNPELVGLASRLSLHVAAFGGIVGFGKVKQPEAWLQVRTELVQAMESFIVAHEYGHFLAQEDYPDSGGVRPGGALRDLEKDCDTIALALSIRFGHEHRNPFAFFGVGVVLLFGALSIVDEVRQQVMGEQLLPSQSHPGLIERMEAVAAFVDSATSEETREPAQRSIWLAFLMLEALREGVQMALAQVSER